MLGRWLGELDTDGLLELVGEADGYGVGLFDGLDPDPLLSLDVFDTISR